jgi:nucleoside-diphosphate-sugar epimerase
MNSESCLVIGATGMVGGYLIKRAAAEGLHPIGLARSTPDKPGWLSADVADLAALGDRLPACATIFSTASITSLALAVPVLAARGARRVVAFTTTSIMTKLDSPIAEERIGLQKLVKGEQDFIAACQQRGVAWTILRPTIIYAEGTDINVTRLANLIRRFGFLPIAGGGTGLRRPVHAEDLAIGAIAAARSDRAANKTYVLSGADTITYHEMAGRIFDGLDKPRRIVAVPASLWRLAFKMVSPFFPGANAAMGDRMNQDMAFDSADAVRDFGWNPRGFRPVFTGL